MGMHGRGHVFWGYDLGEFVDAECESTAPVWLLDSDGGVDGDAWEKEAARRLGWTPVSSDRIDWDLPREQLYETEPYKAYTAARDALQELITPLGVELDTYGHCDYAYHRVQVVESKRDATYECTRIDVSVGPHWREMLDRFMALLALPVPDSEPGWFVTSSWG